jgi:hypothetical protein
LLNREVNWKLIKEFLNKAILKLILFMLILVLIIARGMHIAIKRICGINYATLFISPAYKKKYNIIPLKKDS